MLLHYLHLAVRKLWTEKSFSALNITGLSLGTVSCALIMMYVSYERSYDQLRSPEIYRVSYHGFQHNVETGNSAQTVPAITPAMKQDMPEVMDAVRIVHTSPLMADPVMQEGDKNFRERRIYYADAAFLEMFSYTMRSGSAAKALAEPDQVVISESIAKKYFGNEDALGKLLTFHRGERGINILKITGVFADVPPNSHLHTDFLISFNTIGVASNLDVDWEWGNFYNYVKLHPGVDPSVVEAKIPALLKKYIGEYLEADAGSGYPMELRLQPIRSIHLDSKLHGELEANGDRRTVNFLSIIAVFILLIAWMNYINFAIARSAENSKEISIRKISGSSRFQLMQQLMVESVVVNIVSLVISVAIIQAVTPLLKATAGLPEGLSFTSTHVIMIGGLFIIGTICSGLYPAYFISTIKPVSLLKAKISRSALGLNLNRALIVFQFTASVVLIIGTVTIYRQLNYMRMEELGINLEQTLIVKGPAVKDSMYSSHLEFFYNQAAKLPGVSSMAVSSSIPGQELHWGRQFYRKGDPDYETGVNIVAVDEHFFDLFEADFAAGGNFSDGSTLNKDAIIFNETAVKLLGYTKPGDIIGETIIWNENEQDQQPKRVVGVVKDFNQQSLRNEVGPIVFTLKKYVFAPWAGEFYSFKLPGNSLESSIASLHGVWKEIYPGNPFDYFFLDEFFDAQYKNDQHFGKVFGMFSGLAILIACLGLFGLSSYMTTLRTKEIGVRKVLGSTVFGIVGLLSKGFMMWVMIAFIIACPIAAYVMNQWLSQFAYQIELSPWIFIFSGLICLTIALLTVGIRSWKAANIDPAKALKYE